MNSQPVRDFVKGYSEDTQISTHIFEYVKIPQYDPNDSRHRKLAEYSLELHKVTGEGPKNIDSEILQEINQLVTNIMT